MIPNELDINDSSQLRLETVEDGLNGLNGLNGKWLEVALTLPSEQYSNVMNK